MSDDVLNQRIAQFEKMAGDDPDNDMAHFSLGGAYAAAGRHADAAASYIRCTELNEGMSKAFQLAAASLIERGILERHIDADDRRRAPMRLTEEGQAIYAAVIPRALESERHLLDALSEDEAETLHALLSRLSAVVSPDSPLWGDE